MDNMSSLDDIFEPESFGLVDEGHSSYITKAQFRRDNGDPSVHPEDNWVAIKTASILPEFSKQPHDIYKELRIISTVSHVNIISVLGYFYEDPMHSLHFWMPYIPLSLDQLFSCSSFSPYNCPQDLSSSPEQDREHSQSFTVLAKSIIYQIIAAIAYLHGPTCRIAHRDIKPRNILITVDGTVKLIDFGISWMECIDPSTYEQDLWPEPPGQMCFDVASGPYRAPELLFGPTTYDAFATDMWSFGATCAEFFTPLRKCRPHDEDSDDSDPEDEEDDAREKAQEGQPFIIPASLARYPPETCRWSRNTLFDARRGAIGLAWSIFKIHGTPSKETWPSFTSLPDAAKVIFQSTPCVDLQELLPNLPLDDPVNNTSSALDFLLRLLVYEPSSRIQPVNALCHPWLTADPPFLLPPGYPEQGNESFIRHWHGRQLRAVLLAHFGSP